MKQEEFQKGMVLLSEAFPKLEFSTKLYWAMLNDLEGVYFLMAIRDFILGTKEIYPTSNPIAILRESVLMIQHQEESKKRLRLQRETEVERLNRWKKEAVPMPEESKELLTKFGIKSAK